MLLRECGRKMHFSLHSFHSHGTALAAQEGFPRVGNIKEHVEEVERGAHSKE